MLALAGCGGGDPAPASRAAPSPSATATATAAVPRVPALCERLRTRVIGRAPTPPAGELSGLVRSRSGGFWTHNDSGDSPRIFGLGRDGRLRSEVALAGAENVDWEDIAIRGRTLYVGDIGDNLAQRPEIVVYRLPEPPPGATSAAAERIALRYPDGAHDAEALLVDPRDGSLVIVTKDFGGIARRLHRHQPPARRDAEARRRPGDHGRRRVRRRPRDRPAQLRPRVRLDPAQRRVAGPRAQARAVRRRARTCSPRVRARR